MEITLEVHTGLHLKPSYFGHKGGFTKLNKCDDCDMVGISENMHCGNACSNCGGKVIEDFAVGKWINDEWHIRQNVDK